MQSILQQVESCLESFDLRKRLPHKSYGAIQKETGLDYSQIHQTVVRIRKGLGIKVNKADLESGNPLILHKDRNTIINMCRDNNLTRKLANKERESCDLICKALMNYLPKGGAGMLIGTPTMFCANNTPNNNLLLTDNFEVASILKWTTAVPMNIVIGDAVDWKKASLKAYHWTRNNTTNRCRITTAPVTAETFEGYIESLVWCLPLVKVVLMTSGVWKCCKTTRRKYDFNFNFRAPAKRLTKKHKNLHILAMTYDGSRHFNVRWLRHGKDTLVK